MIAHLRAAGSRANRQAGTPALRCRTFCGKEGRDRRHQEWILEHAVAEWVIKSLTVRDLITRCIGGGYGNAPFLDRDFGCKVLMARPYGMKEECRMQNAESGAHLPLSSFFWVSVLSVCSCS